MNPQVPSPATDDGSATPAPKSAKVTIQSLSPTSQGIPAAPPVYESRPVSVSAPVKASAPVRTATAAAPRAPMESHLPAPHVHMHTHAEAPPSPPESAMRRLAKYWYAVGGGSLLLSIGVHAVLLVLAYFVITKIVNPEKPIDFLSGGGNKAGDAASRDLSHLLKQKRRESIRKTVPMQKNREPVGTLGHQTPGPTDG